MPTRKTDKARTAKTTAKKRSVNVTGHGKKPAGAPFSEQDPKRRLGNFVGAGEHARQGGRQAGIVGQKKQKSKTDKKGS